MWGVGGGTGLPPGTLPPGTAQFPSHPAAVLAPPSAGMYGSMPPLVGGAVVPAPIAATSSTTTTTTTTAPHQKHDVFVGNLAFNTTEEQLHQTFSEIGRVLNVRLVSDETGKPRGFAFVEFDDPQAALSAIRNMNDVELNGRRLRVNFSNSSHLETLAAKLGMDLSVQQSQRASAQAAAAAAASGGAPAPTGTSAVADALKAMSKAEMYDVVAKLKEIADRDPDEARRILASHPQLPEALLFLMSKLDMVKTPVAMTNTIVTPNAPLGGAANLSSSAGMAATSAGVPGVTPTPRAADPRAAAAVAPSDPRQQTVAARVDPRQRLDPRTASAAARTVVPQPPPPVPLRPPVPAAPLPPAAAVPAASSAYAPLPTPAGLPLAALPLPPPLGVPGLGAPVGHALPPMPPSAAMAHLDPSFVQQVMSLTPQQIQQLPPDRQQSILQLRQQIMGGAGL